MDPNCCLKDEEDQYVNDRFGFLDEHGVGDTDGQTDIMQPSLRAQNTHTLDVTGQDVGQIEVKCLQAHVQALEDVLVEDPLLLLAGCSLEDGDASLCTLKVAGRGLGGGVQGTLGHPGGVRGQTPKAGKQKKKKKTGRAMHRKQYNKWFKNGVPIFGNKKGRTQSSKT